jgi:hypothetical protein
MPTVRPSIRANPVILYEFFHVVGLGRVAGNQCIEGRLHPVQRIVGDPRRRRLAIRQWQKIEQPPHLYERVDIVVTSKIGHGRARRVGRRAAQLFLCHLLVSHRLHHIRAGDEHVRRIAHHEDEVSHRGRVDGAAGAGPHDHRELRNDARGEDRVLENISVAGERGNTLLDARAPRVVDADDRRPHLHRLVHDLADFFRVGLGQRAAEHGEVLAEDVN